LNRLLVVLALAAPLAGGAEPLPLRAAPQQARTPEDIKAGLLYSFAKATVWPAKDLPKGAPFILGVMGPAIVTQAIQKNLKDKAIDGHPITIQVAEAVAGLAGAHLAYVADSGDGQLPANGQALLQATNGKPTLTISDDPKFAEGGGVLNFYTEVVNGADRMRFEINPKAAEKAGLGVTSLLQVAPKVTGKVNK
jgi:hypothetical protein